MASELNAGEGAQTKHKIDDAKVLRVKLLKMAEAVDAVSKRVASLDLGEDDDALDPMAMGSYATLKSRIRIASVNFVKVSTSSKVAYALYHGWFETSSLVFE